MIRTRAAGLGAFWRQSRFFGYGARYEWAPSAGEAESGTEHRTAALVAWLPSEFQRIRLQVAYDRRPGGQDGLETLLQLEFGIGARRAPVHKEIAMRPSHRHARAAHPRARRRAEPVVTTTEGLAALAREVGGSRVRVESLSRGAQDPHFVDADPIIAVKLRDADLLVDIGLDLEIGWLPPLVDQSRNARIQPGGPRQLTAASVVQVLDVPTGVVDRSLAAISTRAGTRTSSPTHGRSRSPRRSPSGSRRSIRAARRGRLPPEPRRLPRPHRGERSRAGRRRSRRRRARSSSPSIGRSPISSAGPGSRRRASSSRSPACRRRLRTSPTSSAWRSATGVKAIVLETTTTGDRRTWSRHAGARVVQIRATSEGRISAVTSNTWT